MDDCESEDRFDDDSNYESEKSSDDGDDDDDNNNNGEYDLDTFQGKVEKLKSLRMKINWGRADERGKIYRLLDPAHTRWTERRKLPNLRGIFRQREIERLLLDAVERSSKSLRAPELRLIDFVARTGYRDKPQIDATSGKPVLRRTTPVHLAARRSSHARVVAELFQIYASFEANYQDDTGLTHLHVACACGCAREVERFLKLGQDPNRPWPRTGASPLHIAAANGRGRVIQTLLRHGADPNLVNKDGSTPLHIICQSGDTDRLAELFFDVIDHQKRRQPQKQVEVDIDARDKLGRTPLQLAVANLLPSAVEVLLERGADMLKFVFPSEDCFVEQFKASHYGTPETKLRLVAGTMAMIEDLREAGYKLRKNDAMIIMKLFAKHDFFEDCEELFNAMDRDVEFTSRLKRLQFNDELTLYELFDALPEELPDLVEPTDYLRFARSGQLRFFTTKRRRDCVAALCKISSWHFCERWFDHYHRLGSSRMYRCQQCGETKTKTLLTAE